MLYVQHNYELPLEEYSWQLTLHDILRDSFIDASAKIIKKVKGEEFEWKDDQAVVDYALSNNLLPEIMKEMEEDLKANYFG